MVGRAEEDYWRGAKKKPTESDSLICLLRILCWGGLRLRVKNAGDVIGEKHNN